MGSEADRTGEAGRPTLFLSYAHADARRAEAIAAALEQRGYTVWWDTLIEGGASFARSIREALEAADAVLVLWSKSSIESDWVADEAAQGRDRKRLVPLSLDGSLPPLGFRQYQTIDLSGRTVKPSAAQVERIERAIRAAIGQEARAAAACRCGAPAGIDRRRALLLGGGAAAVLAGGGALRVSRRFVRSRRGASAASPCCRSRISAAIAAQAYLSDGLTDEVRAALTRNAGLRVLAATSSNAAREDGGRRQGDRGQAGGGASARRIGPAVGRRGARVDRTDRRQDRLFDLVEADRRPAGSTFSHSRARSRGPCPKRCRCAWRPRIRRRAERATSRLMKHICAARRCINLSKDEASDREARALFENAIVADPNFALARASLVAVAANLRQPICERRPRSGRPTTRPSPKRKKAVDARAQAGRGASGTGIRANMPGTMTSKGARAAV